MSRRLPRRGRLTMTPRKLTCAICSKPIAPTDPAALR